jgi:hypothetical protein
VGCRGWACADRCGCCSFTLKLGPEKEKEFWISLPRSPAEGDACEEALVLDSPAVSATLSTASTKPGPCLIFFFFVQSQSLDEESKRSDRDMGELLAVGVDVDKAWQLRQLK